MTILSAYHTNVNVSIPVKIMSSSSLYVYCLQEFKTQKNPVTFSDFSFP